MNKFKKIGLSALAGSLVAMSASAYEITMSGGASVAATTATAASTMDISSMAMTATATTGGLQLRLLQLLLLGPHCCCGYC